MDIVFVSNYYNHHQAPFSEALARIPGISYCFVETWVMSEERKRLGYDLADYPSFVIRNEEFISDKTKCQTTINDADIVIFGSAPEELLKTRQLNNKPIIRYSERLYKQTMPLWKLQAHYLADRFQSRKYSCEYLFCASAFAALDYTRAGRFIGKTYKWGYFPATYVYDENQLIRDKKRDSILWVGRYIDWKHPEVPILIAEMLKKEGFAFQLNMLGDGMLFNSLQNMINEKQLGDCVSLSGPVPYQKVRSYMEKSAVFLATSDRNEGWGAVVNEAMNSGCAVVADSETGSVPFLINTGRNGLIYADGDINAAYNAVKYLLSHDSERDQMSINAYKTIINTWNAETAADRFIACAKEIMKSGHCDLFDEGPCSRAEVIKDGWFRG